MLEAEEMKQRLEQQQRDRLRLFADGKAVYSPRWFMLVITCFVHCSFTARLTHFCTPCLKKTVQTYFVPELCQISTNCKNFRQRDSKENKLFWGILIFHLT